MGTGNRRDTTIWIIGSILLIIYCLFPVAYILSLSFKAPTEMTNQKFLPESPTWGNFEEIFRGAASELFLSALEKLIAADDALGHVVNAAGKTVGFVSAADLQAALFAPQ